MKKTALYIFCFLLVAFATTLFFSGKVVIETVWADAGPTYEQGFSRGFVRGVSVAPDAYQEYQIRCVDLDDKERVECLRLIINQHCLHEYLSWGQP